MLAQIKQVSLVYTTQRALWLGLALFSAVAIPNALALAQDPGESSGMNALFLVGLPALALLPFLVGSVKMQFAHSRARLMPKFLPAHLVVLSGILTAGLVLYPLALCWLSGNRAPLGLLALVFAIAGGSIWGAQLNRFLPMLVAIGVFYSLMTSWGLNWWIISAHEHRAAHAIVLAVGVGLIIAWLWRLTHLTEEMDDYQNVYLAMLARRTGSEAVEQRRVVASAVVRNRLTVSIGDWWHARLGGYYGGSKAGLVRLVRYGYMPQPVEVQGFFLLAMFIALGVFISQFSLLNDGGVFGALWLFAMFGVVLPGQMAGELLAQRRPRMTSEMLLPLLRAQFVDALLAAAIRNALILWLIMSAGLGVIVAAARPQLSLQSGLMFVVLSATATFVTSAISLRLSILPSLALRLTAMWLALMVVALPIGGLWWSRGRLGDWPLVLLAGILVALGVAVVKTARRAWMNLEIV